MVLVLKRGLLLTRGLLTRRLILSLEAGLDDREGLDGGVHVGDELFQRFYVVSTCLRVFDVLQQFGGQDRRFYDGGISANWT